MWASCRNPTIQLGFPPGADPGLHDRVLVSSDPRQVAIEEIKEVSRESPRLYKIRSDEPDPQVFISPRIRWHQEPRGA